ncbi:MAG: hypothetical protein KatS3mg081_0306 [Gemmatimonadales bacterium]|nr:MAG: hypothetical protein KatS3mg081_0306 [Gemmatimonadales bacterium]
MRRPGKASRTYRCRFFPKSDSQPRWIAGAEPIPTAVANATPAEPEVRQRVVDLASGLRLISAVDSLGVISWGMS